MEEALRQLLTFNGLTYKVLRERAILISRTPRRSTRSRRPGRPDVFYLSTPTPPNSASWSAPSADTRHGDHPDDSGEQDGNTLIVRGTRPVVEIIERLVAQNDKPKAEIVFDIEILEVDRNRVKNYGLNLSEYALGRSSPRKCRREHYDPDADHRHADGGAPTTPTTTTTTTATGGRPHRARSRRRRLNLNTISQGISTADFYVAVPTAGCGSSSLTRTRRSSASHRYAGRRGQADAQSGQRGAGHHDELYADCNGGRRRQPSQLGAVPPVGINVDILPRFSLAATS